MLYKVLSQETSKKVENFKLPEYNILGLQDKNLKSVLSSSKTIKFELPSSFGLIYNINTLLFH